MKAIRGCDKSRISYNVSREVEPYNGPTRDMLNMEMIFNHTKTSIRISVGPSVVGSGWGLYFSIPDSERCIILPKGTHICDYNHGFFINEKDIFDNDKCVDFSLESVYTGVVFNDETSPLIDAIFSVYDPEKRHKLVVSSSTEGASAFKCENDYLSSLVYGHILRWNDKACEILIDTDPQITSRIYIPIENYTNTVYKNEKVSSLKSSNMFGIYANDFAFNSSIIKTQHDEDLYNNLSSRNILTLLWRLAANKDGVLMPVCPVVVISKDVNLTNHKPMEVGLHYGWSFWKPYIS